LFEAFEVDVEAFTKAVINGAGDFVDVVPDLAQLFVKRKCQFVRKEWSRDILLEDESSNESGDVIASLMCDGL